MKDKIKIISCNDKSCHFEHISEKELKARFKELFETLELEKEKDREYHGFYVDENGKVRHTDNNLKGEKE